MEEIFSKFSSLPIPESALTIRPEVLEKIKNFKKFLLEIKTSDPSEEEEKFTAMLNSQEVDTDASRLLFVLSKFLIPNIGEDRLEAKLREKYGYAEEHSVKIKRYLTYLRLVYSDEITF